MDDSENAKSVEGANIAWLNESNQFTLEDYDYIGTTIRGQAGVKVSMILDWNPQTIQHWLKKESDVFKDKENCKLVKSSFWDNYLIDRDLLHAKLLKIKERDENLYNVWALGEWGIEDPEMNFFRDFRKDKHVKETEKISPTYYLTFDLNYDPSCLVIQREGNKQYVIDELHDRGLGLAEVCTILKERYKLNATNTIINGDSSGNHSRNISDSRTSYQIIQNVLNLTLNNFHVQKANPTHVGSRIVCNIVLRIKDFRINPKCVKFIKDIETMQVDGRGSLDPWKKNNPNLGHLGDAWRYHVFYEDYDLSNIELN
jgi:PBSX family phage terminase large subunit